VHAYLCAQRGIIAAATTSLPEVIGGGRNYDYRYVWLRDAAMITSALAQAGNDGEEERLFLFSDGFAVFEPIKA
jgi:GH15 family glucan-1,4-alpha-glucosidase